MLLIQTALEQEFRAVASALQRTEERPRELAHTVGPLFGRIAQRPCGVLKSGIGGRLAMQAMSKAFAQVDRPQLVLSIGLAGALALEGRVGQRYLVGQVVNDSREPSALCASLNLLAPEYQRSVPVVSLVSVDRPVLSAQAKQGLHRASRASLCDMETHAVAQAAVARGVPWLGARIVSDSARERLPGWFLTLPGLVERRAWGGVARQLATHPQDLPGLLRLAMRMKRLERQLAQFTVELIRNVVQP